MILVVFRHCSTCTVPREPKIAQSKEYTAHDTGIPDMILRCIPSLTDIGSLGLLYPYVLGSPVRQVLFSSNPSVGELGTAEVRSV